MDINRLLRNKLPDTDPFPVANAVKFDVKLDQNESPFDLPDDLKDRCLDFLKKENWQRYPQSSWYRDVKKRVAEILKIYPEQLALTVGCDQAIQGIHFLAGGCGRKAAVFQPTYPMLSHAGLMSGTQVKNFILNPDYKPEIFLIKENFHLFLLANPNNPTGNLIEESFLKKILGRDAIIFVDESYFDFSKKTMIHFLNKYPNLVIGRSCSKTLLAGARVGFLIASPLIIRKFESLITAPYHLSAFQLTIAYMYRELQPYIEKVVSIINKEKIYLIEHFKKLGITFYPSSTNFILFHTRYSQKLFNYFLENGIRIRNMSSFPNLNNHLRVTVGSHTENEKFISVLYKYFCV